MSSDVVWLYFVIGELATLLVLSNEEGTAQIRSLAQRGWWAPYAWANVMIDHGLAGCSSAVLASVQEQMKARRCEVLIAAMMMGVVKVPQRLEWLPQQWEPQRSSKWRPSSGMS